ncbi:MAG: hypothetical protein U0872_15295 [Planctomycetaceae bacterium]
MLTTTPSKFIGKKASPCRKCNGILHYVNPMGGVSCFSCYPPRKPEHVSLRLICESGVWTAEGDAFFDGSSDKLAESSEPSSIATSRPEAALPAGPHPAAARPVVRRKSSEPYTDLELDWVFRPGGIIDQMDESASRRPYRPAVSRAGETISERNERLSRWSNDASGSSGNSRDRLVPSDVGAVPAELTVDLDFGGPRSVPGAVTTFLAGTPCLLFPGRVIPDRDPEAAEVRGSLAVHAKHGRRVAVIRLDGKLRIVRDGDARTV